MSDTVNSNQVNFNFSAVDIRFYFNCFGLFTVCCHSNCHLIRRRTFRTNDFELTMPNLYFKTTSTVNGIYTSIPQPIKKVTSYYVLNEEDSLKTQNVMISKCLMIF